MADLSKYCFTGRLGQDAVVKTTDNGKHVMEASVAVNTGYGDYKSTQWIKACVWGDHTPNIVNIFKKGCIVTGCGEPKPNAWQGKDGTAHAELQVRCLDLQLLSSPSKGENATQSEAGGVSSEGEVNW